MADNAEMIRLPALLAIEPMGAPRLTQRDRWKGRPVVVRYHAYRDALRLSLPGYELPERISLVFYLPMPASKSKKWKTAHYHMPHDQKPDIDNLVKGFMDSFGSDQHVYAVQAEKYWADSGMIVINEYVSPAPLQLSLAA